MDQMYKTYAEGMTEEKLILKYVTGGKDSLRNSGIAETSLLKKNSSFRPTPLKV
jgi:hypothetical protein